MTCTRSRVAWAMLIAITASAAGADEPLEVRVLSFNIRWFPQDKPGQDGENRWSRRLPIVASVIRDSKADAVGIQEGSAWHLGALLKALPEYSAYEEGSAGGLHVLYRKARWRVDLKASRSRAPRSERPDKDWGRGSVRIPIWARLVEREGGRAFYLYNVHHDHRSAGSRAWSGRLLARKIAARKHADPVVVTGDFNAGEQSPSMRFLRGEAKLAGETNPVKLFDSFRIVHALRRDVGTYHGFTGRGGSRKIDHVLVGKGAIVLEAAIIRRQSSGRYPSDHFPVSARIQWK